jgi:hypothetical protein
MSGPLAIAALVGFLVAVLELGRRIPPRGAAETRHGADLPLFPFGRQPTEPIDAERARGGRYF